MAVGILIRVGIAVGSAVVGWACGGDGVMPSSDNGPLPDIPEKDDNPNLDVPQDSPPEEGRDIPRDQFVDEGLDLADILDGQTHPDETEDNHPPVDVPEKEPEQPPEQTAEPAPDNPVAEEVADLAEEVVPPVDVPPEDVPVDVVDCTGTITCGTGECERIVDKCIDGVLQTCTPGTPSIEECNGKDDDCDGLTDNKNLNGDRLVEVMSCGLGECVGGTRENVCLNSTWTGFGICSTDWKKKEEICDGKDNDCNGEIDPGCKCIPSTYVPELINCGKGECAALGETSCVDGAVINVCQPGKPGIEECDGKDNNCDGLTDNRNENGDPLVEIMECGLGECAGGTKENVCLNKAWTGFGICSTDWKKQTEICDGIDNNCDGSADNGLTAPLANKHLGVCEHSVKVCMGVDGWQEPDYYGIADYESTETKCDGFDNDCDGSTDEDLGTTTCGTGGCKITVDKCKDGVSQECAPNHEVAITNDLVLNGYYDENLTDIVQLESFKSMLESSTAIPNSTVIYFKIESVDPNIFKTSTVPGIRLCYNYSDECNLYGPPALIACADTLTFSERQLIAGKYRNVWYINAGGQSRLDVVMSDPVAMGITTYNEDCPIVFNTFSCPAN